MLGYAQAGIDLLLSRGFLATRLAGAAARLLGLAFVSGIIDGRGQRETWWQDIGVDPLRRLLPHTGRTPPATGGRRGFLGYRFGNSTNCLLDDIRLGLILIARQIVAARAALLTVFAAIVTIIATLLAFASVAILVAFAAGFAWLTLAMTILLTSISRFGTLLLIADTLAFVAKILVGLAEIVTARTRLLLLET